MSISMQTTNSFGSIPVGSEGVPVTKSTSPTLLTRSRTISMCESDSSSSSSFFPSTRERSMTTVQPSSSNKLTPTFFTTNTSSAFSSSSSSSSSSSTSALKLSAIPITNSSLKTPNALTTKQMSPKSSPRSGQQASPMSSTRSALKILFDNGHFIPEVTTALKNNLEDAILLSKQKNKLTSTVEKKQQKLEKNEEELLKGELNDGAKRKRAFAQQQQQTVDGHRKTWEEMQSTLDQLNEKITEGLIKVVKIGQSDMRFATYEIENFTMLASLFLNHFELILRFFEQKTHNKLHAQKWYLAILVSEQTTKNNDVALADIALKQDQHILVPDEVFALLVKQSGNNMLNSVLTLKHEDFVGVLGTGRIKEIKKKYGLPEESKNNKK